ncbi:MAG: hypothetical protein ABIF92_00545, partial [archaeon]
VAIYESLLDKTDEIEVFGGDYRFTKIDSLVVFMYEYKMDKERFHKRLEKSGILPSFRRYFHHVLYRFISYGLGFATKCKELEKEYDWAYHLVGQRHVTDIEAACEIFKLETERVFMPEKKEKEHPLDKDKEKLTRMYLRYAKKAVGTDKIYELVKAVRDNDKRMEEIKSEWERI